MKSSLFLHTLMIELPVIPSKEQQSAISPLLELWKTPRQVVITTHYNPDGDAIGSSLALAHYLRKKGHLVTVIVPNDYPKFLHWLPGHHQVVNYELQTGIAQQAMQSAHVLCCLDFNDPSRVHAMEADIQSCEAIKVLIDHHLQPAAFADYMWHTTLASSTAELVYDLMAHAGDLHLLDTDIASCLYTGILTDTGSFQHSSTTPRVHHIAGNLMEAGVDTFAIYDAIFNSSSINRMRFFGFCWSQRMHVDAKKGYAIIDVSINDQLRFYLQKGDTEGLVNTPLQIDGIRVSVLATEQDGYIKLSFRSKGDIDVNEMARTYFNGGGHKNASGGIVRISLEETVIQLKRIVPTYSKKQS